MQIYKKGTVLETVDGNTPLQPNCVQIDVFPYDAVPDNWFIKRLMAYGAMV